MCRGDDHERPAKGSPSARIRLGHAHVCTALAQILHRVPHLRHSVADPLGIFPAKPKKTCSQRANGLWHASCILRKSGIGTAVLIKASRRAADDLAFQESVLGQMTVFEQRGPYRGPVFLEFQFFPESKQPPSFRGDAVVELIELVRCGWGYDGFGQRHGPNATVIQFRREPTVVGASPFVARRRIEHCSAFCRTSTAGTDFPCEDQLSSRNQRLAHHQRNCMALIRRISWAMARPRRHRFARMRITYSRHRQNPPPLQAGCTLLLLWSCHKGRPPAAPMLLFCGLSGPPATCERRIRRLKRPGQDHHAMVAPRLLSCHNLAITLPSGSNTAIDEDSSHGRLNLWLWKRK